MKNIGRFLLELFVFIGGWLLFHQIIDLTGFAQINSLTGILSIILTFLFSLTATIIVFRNR